MISNILSCNYCRFFHTVDASCLTFCVYKSIIVVNHCDEVIFIYLTKIIKVCGECNYGTVFTKEGYGFL